MSLPVVTKVYTLDKPKEGEICRVTVVRSYRTDSYETDPGPCGKGAIRVVDIVTVTVKGRTVHNRVGFCYAHWAGKYAKWFGGTGS